MTKRLGQRVRWRHGRLRCDRARLWSQRRSLTHDEVHPPLEMHQQLRRVQSSVGRNMDPAQPFDECGIERQSRFAQEHVGQEATAHADLAMDAPHRKLDVLAIQGLALRKHVLVDSVDQRPVEIENKGRVGSGYVSPSIDGARQQRAENSASTRSGTASRRAI